MNYVAMKRNNENDLRIFQLNEKSYPQGTFLLLFQQGLKKEGNFV